MSALVQPTKGYYWEVFDKKLDTAVYTLTETGETKVWYGPRFEHTILVFPDVEAAATWCIGARNQHPHLSRAHGWHLEWRAHALRSDQIAILVWWEELTEGTELIGPLLDLDVAIRRYFSRIDAPKESAST